MADLNQNESMGQQEQPKEEQTPTVEELMTQIAQKTAENEKLKLALDKSSSETANYKKQLQARKTAQEQEDDAKREAEEQHRQYVKGLEDYKALMESKDRHMTMGMDAEMASEAAKMDIKNDKDGLTAIYKKFNEQTRAAQRKADEIEFKTRPDPAFGGEEEDAFLKGFNSVTPLYSR